MRAARAWVVLAVCAGSAGAAETWIEVRTPNFTLVSNAGEGTARQTIWEFEQVRAAYARAWPWAKLAESRRPTVVALRDERSLKQWAPRYYERKGQIDIVSVSAHGAERDYLLLRTDARPNQADVTPNFNLYRAYLGALFSASFERRLPVWLSIGLEEVFGNTSVQGKEVQLGRPVPWHVRQFNQHARLPLRTILETQPGSPLLTRDGDRDVFDAQAWALVHYLSFGDQGAHLPQLNRFIELWLKGQPHEQALSAAFGDLQALEKELPVYASRPLMGFGRLLADVNIERDKPPARVLAPAELLSLQAAVHVAMDRPAEAGTALEQARAADAQFPGSYDAEGLLADRQQDRERAQKAFARAGELGSTSAYSYYRAAQLAFKPQADAAALAANRKLLERAVELNGTYAPAQSYLADVMQGQGQAQAALPFARRAVALEPGDSYHHVVLGRVLGELGQKDAARAEGQRALQLAASDGERANAQRFLDYLQESAAFEQRRAAQQTAQKDAEACQAGETAACARLLPALENECSQGQSGACNYAAYLYSEGRGVAKNAAQAARLVEQACAAGDKRACVEHAWLLVRGDALAKDEAKGQALLEGLCSAGTFAACTRLAALHAARPGSASRQRARELLARACEGGEADACTMAKQMK